MTRCAAAIRAGRSGKNSATSTGKLIRAQAAATRALSSPRACCVKRIHWRSSEPRSARPPERRRPSPGLPGTRRSPVTAGAVQQDLGREPPRLRRQPGGPDCPCIGSSLRLCVRAFIRETAGDDRNARAQETVGAAHDRVLLMQDAWNPQQRGRKQRWNGRIAAKPDDRARLDALELDERRRDARAQYGRRFNLVQPARACCRRGRKRMDRASGKVLSVFQRPIVGCEFDLSAALRERRGERGGRKDARRCRRRQQNAAPSAHSAATR